MSLCPRSIRSGCLALMLAGFHNLCAQSTVEQWGVFELTLSGPTNGNPFLDVRFAAKFSQGPVSIEVPGFYDGDGNYRVCFMPETQGKWSYATTSSAPELAGKTGELTATSPAAGDHGPVHVTNTFHFAYSDGSPYKELGTTCYVWTHQPEALQEQTLQTLAASPFNKIRFCVFPTQHAEDTNEPEIYPFAGAPNHFDTSHFNPVFFQQFERRILDLQKLGIEADVILFHPYDGGMWGFDRLTPPEDDRYLRYVVARFAAYRNVWWSLANEYDLMKHKTEDDWERIGETVSSSDPFHHLLSIHNSMRILNPTRPWITHASIQNGAAVENPNTAEIYRDAFRKPIVYDEVKYEGEPTFAKRWGNLSAEELVYRFWTGTIAGTYVGHSETFKSPAGHVWMSQGGVLEGQSVPRLAFLKKVLDDSPAEGIEPIDKWQNPEYGGKASEYYLVYLGKATLTNWVFQLPKPPSGKGLPPADGMKFTAEVLDTWNMTVTPVPGTFTLVKQTDYFHADKDGRSIPLPGRPYMAIRIKRVKD